VARERRWTSRYLSIEDLESGSGESAADARDAGLDRQRALDQLYGLIRDLRPLDRQIILLWLEDVEAAGIAEVTGLSSANVAMKTHRIKNVLARRFRQRQEEHSCPNRPGPSL
jgi:RNA polymerase sigma-70 factor (ECF subfamily)